MSFSDELHILLFAIGTSQMERRIEIVKDSSPPDVTLQNPALLSDAALRATVRENPHRATLLKEFGVLAAELNGVQVASSILGKWVGV